MTQKISLKKKVQELEKENQELTDKMLFMQRALSDIIQICDMISYRRLDEKYRKIFYPTESRLTKRIFKFELNKIMLHAQTYLKFGNLNSEFCLDNCKSMYFCTLNKNHKGKHCDELCGNLKW